MKKKGFTLVELLAVIAILAILVIVAMPNVLGMFNQAKYNTFVTEVQSYMDSAKTAFVSEALSAPAQTIKFSSYTLTGGKKVSMSGNKGYYIEMDRYGKYTRVVIWDTNFCYDTKQATVGANTTNIDKSKVKADDVYVSKKSGNPTDSANTSGYCSGTKATAQ